LNVDISLKSPILSVSGALASAPLSSSCTLLSSLKASASLLCYITAQGWEDYIVSEGAIFVVDKKDAYKVRVMKRHY
jgi:hypothetical protein